MRVAVPAGFSGWLCAGVLFAGATLSAVAGDDPDHLQDSLSIRAAEVDCEAALATVQGEFGDPSTLQVTLDRGGPLGPEPLSIGASSTGSTLVVLLPEGGCEPPGTYRLTVARPHRHDKRRRCIVIYGNRLACR